MPSSPAVKDNLLSRYPLLVAGLITGPLGRIAACVVGSSLGYLKSTAFHPSAIFGIGYVMTLLLVPFSKEKTISPGKFIVGCTAGSYLIVLTINTITLFVSASHANLYPYRFWYDPLLTAITCGTSAILYCAGRQAVRSIQQR